MLAMLNFQARLLTRLTWMCRHPSAVGCSSKAAVAGMQMSKEASQEAI